MTGPASSESNLIVSATSCVSPGFTPLTRQSVLLQDWACLRKREGELPQFCAERCNSQLELVQQGADDAMINIEQSLRPVYELQLCMY